MVALVGYAIVVFVVLIVALLRMRDRHWNRAGVIVLMLLVPIILEVLFEVHFPMLGFFMYSSLHAIARNGCYGLGAIVFIFAFSPILAGDEKSG